MLNKQYPNTLAVIPVSDWFLFCFDVVVVVVAAVGAKDSCGWE